jgi:hypothetical protein
MVNIIQRWLAGGLFLLLLFGWPQATLAEPVVTIVDNGDPTNRVDLVVLGDGYTAGEMSKYANDVQQFIQGLFAQDPFKEYQGFFNVHRVDVISNESGADHPELNPPVFRDTAFDATYNCFGGIQRALCVNNSKVLTIVSNSLSPSQRDIILVIVNDPEYGGTGGGVVVVSTNSAVVELILHETGHSFGLLADEYGGPPPPDCNASFEPFEPNATKETQRPLIKWGHWIDPSTSIPTRNMLPGIPGLYEGAKYCDNGLFRPTFNSKMRTLGPPFEQVNTEQLVKRIYNLVSPIDASEPSGSTVTLTQGQNETFGVQVPQPSTHSLEIAWKVDGQTLGTSADFTLISSSLTLGSHAVEVTVSDPTPLVRNDSAGVLEESQIWSVNVITGSTHTLTITSGPSGTPNPVASGGTASLSVSAVDSLGHGLSYAWTASCPTLGSSGSFTNPNLQAPTWTASPNTTGSQQTCTIQVTVSDSQGLSQVGSYAQGVATMSTSPTAAVALNGSGFHTGQTITYQATLIPGSAPTQVDIYLGCLLPDGVTFLSLVLQPQAGIATTAGPSPIPFMAGVTLTEALMVPFSYMFKGTEPVGKYVTYAGLAVAGSDPFQPANQLSLGVQAFQFTP